LATTLKTLRTIVLRWPDETVCYPGTGRISGWRQARGDRGFFEQGPRRVFWGCDVGDVKQRMGNG